MCSEALLLATADLILQPQTPMWNAKVLIWCPLQGTTSQIPISWIVSAGTKPYRQVIPPLITRVSRRAMWIIPASVLERSYRVIYRRRLPFLERSCREWCAVGFRPHHERGNCVIVGKGSPEYLKNRRHSASISHARRKNKSAAAARGKTEKEAEELIDSSGAGDFMKKYFKVEWPER